MLEWDRKHRKSSHWLPQAQSHKDPVGCPSAVFPGLRCTAFLSDHPHQYQMYHLDQCLLVICFKTSLVLTPTQQQERKWWLWAPWQSDCESNCLVLADLHAGGELQSRVWRQSVLSTVLHAAPRARRSDSESVWSHPGSGELNPLLSYTTKA